MQKTNEQKQQARRAWRIATWTLVMFIVNCAECFVIGSLMNLTRTPGIADLLVYQLIIPIVTGFNVTVILIGRKLKPDLYDEYSVTSLTTIEDQGRKMVELHNQFAEERGGKERLAIVKSINGGEK